MLNFFELLFEKKKITKPIRLIELFGGIGSQAKALENLGANFEHYRLCEFDKNAIDSYNAVHHTNHSTSDITELKGKDLGIIDVDKYEYIMTYSFPCQDLSVSGKMAGMKQGSGTRSGLLWEVERLLNESENLPQILLMENVAQVHNQNNVADFEKWINALDKLGYQSYWKDLNAKDFGIPQNRDRCFMVSILGDYYYEFPEPKKLELKLKDLLEEKVDEKFYLSSNKLQSISEWNAYQKPLERVLGDESICPTLTARGAGEEHSGMIMLGEGFKDNTNVQEMYKNKDVEKIKQLKIRTLTPRECWRLMGFSDQDYDNVKDINSSTYLYKQAGNSIVVNVLMAILGELL